MIWNNELGKIKIDKPSPNSEAKKLFNFLFFLNYCRHRRHIIKCFHCLFCFIWKRIWYIYSIYLRGQRKMASYLSTSSSSACKSYSVDYKRHSTVDINKCLKNGPISNWIYHYHWVDLLARNESSVSSNLFSALPNHPASYISILLLTKIFYFYIQCYYIFPLGYNCKWNPQKKSRFF